MSTIMAQGISMRIAWSCLLKAIGDYPIHFQGRGKWHLKLLENDGKGSCHHRETTKSYSANRFCCIK